MRSLGIGIKENSALKLSDEMKREPAGYMARFTKPLLKSIYGDTENEISRFDDLVGLFRNPDIKKALGKLNLISENQGVRLDQIPVFIEDYAISFCHSRITSIALIAFSRRWKVFKAPSSS